MHILVTNDDGVHAPGILALASAMRELGNVTIVAPDQERSAVGHALTLNSPLRVFKLDDGRYAVNGTPTDCVNMGVHRLLPCRPDIVVSGINHGPNLGYDVTYSGTIAAAMEATLMGIPAVAISLATREEHSSHFMDAANVATRVVRRVMYDNLPAGAFLNINVPDFPIEEIKAPVVTRQGRHSFVGNLVDKVDPRGKKYYWIGNGESNFNDCAGTDFYAINRKHVSITPLHLDLTNYEAMQVITSWEF